MTTLIRIAFFVGTDIRQPPLQAMTIIATAVLRGAFIELLVSIVPIRSSAFITRIRASQKAFVMARSVS
jgi:hypothetical protein